jgi:hypothetical protein
MKPLQADSKGRFNLGQAYAGQLFQITAQDEDRIILDKAALIPERELWLHKNREAKVSVETGLEEASQGKICRDAVDLEQDGV